MDKVERQPKLRNYQRANFLMRRTGVTMRICVGGELGT
jgi:hypothetical protein